MLKIVVPIALVIISAFGEEGMEHGEGRFISRLLNHGDDTNHRIGFEMNVNHGGKYNKGDDLYHKMSTRHSKDQKDDKRDGDKKRRLYSANDGLYGSTYEPKPIGPKYPSYLDVLREKHSDYYNPKSDGHNKDEKYERGYGFGAIHAGFNYDAARDAGYYGQRYGNYHNKDERIDNKDDDHDDNVNNGSNRYNQDQKIDDRRFGFGAIHTGNYYNNKDDGSYDKGSNSYSKDKKDNNDNRNGGKNGDKHDEDQSFDGNYNNKNDDDYMKNYDDGRDNGYAIKFRPRPGGF